MGAYLSSPVREKESEEGHDDRLAFGLSAMQGWRVSMEDAHIANLNIDGHHTSLFSVFDGHGGGAVAKFAAKHMAPWLTKMEAYKRGDYGIAIAECYYKLDELLDTEDGQAELRELAGVPPARKTGGGLFDTLEDKLGDDEEEAKPEAPKPKKPALNRIDSSEEFRKSALMRHSVIPGAGGPIAPLESVESGVESDFSASASAAVASTSENDDSEDDAETDASAHNATGMGCTAVSVLISGNKVTVANTGDSRCVMSRRGEATPLTLDHKPIIYEEAQRIIRAGGFVRDNRVNGALNVSRTIGDLDFKRNGDLPHTEQMVVATPDITDLELREGDEFLILACDGIWDVLSNQEAVDFVRKRVRQGQSLLSICEAMCDACLAPDLKGLCRGADNMSVIVVLFKKHADLESFWHKLGSSFTRMFKKKS